MRYPNGLAALNSHHCEYNVSPCKCVSLSTRLDEDDETFLSWGDFNSIRSLTRKLKSNIAQMNSLDEFLDITLEVGTVTLKTFSLDLSFLSIVRNRPYFLVFMNEYECMPVLSLMKVKIVFLPLSLSDQSLCHRRKLSSN